MGELKRDCLTCRAVMWAFENGRMVGMCSCSKSIGTKDCQDWRPSTGLLVVDRAGEASLHKEETQ